MWENTFKNYLNSALNIPISTHHTFEKLEEFQNWKNMFAVVVSSPLTCPTFLGNKVMLPNQVSFFHYYLILDNFFRVFALQMNSVDKKW